jgi:hypothetical protein
MPVGAEVIEKGEKREIPHKLGGMSASYQLVTYSDLGSFVRLDSENYFLVDQANYNPARTSREKLNKRERFGFEGEMKREKPEGEKGID